MQPVDIRVGRQDNFAITQALGCVFDIEAAHQIVQLFILVHHVALKIADVERLTAHREDRLAIDVAATDDRAGRRLAFRDEEHRFGAVPGPLAKMNLAVFKLGYPQRGSAGALARHFLDRLQLPAQLDRLLDLDQRGFGRFGVAMQKIGDDFAHLANPLAPQFGVAELVLGLRFKHRVLQPDGNGACHALPYVIPFEFALGEFVKALDQSLAERAQVRAAVRGVLAVDERKKRFLEALRVSYG